MELSKKAAYLRGLMEGLKFDEESPEGQILKVMAELVADMADAVEDNSYAVDAIADYIDLLEDGSDPLDEIDTYEYGSDPVSPEAEDGGETVTDGSSADDVDDDADDTVAEAETAKPAEDDAASGNSDGEDESIRFNALLENIMTDPNYTDETLEGGSTLVDTLKNMVVRQYAEEEEAEKRAEIDIKNKAISHDPLGDEEREDFISRLESLLSSVQDDEDDEDEDDGFDSVIGRMNCPFCHNEIQLKVSDIAEKVVSCPFCRNKLTIML